MSRAGFAGLGFCAAALGGLIALELSGIEGDQVTSSAASAAAARWHPAPPVPTPPAPDRTQEWAATALARPLFSPDRRPVPEPRMAAAAGGSGGGDLPRLTGVLVGPSGQTAIFAAASEGAKPIVVRVGDSLGGFQVKAILAGEVTLMGPEGEQILRPSFAPHGPAARPAAPAPASPAQPAVIPGLAPAAIPARLPPGLPPLQGPGR